MKTVIVNNEINNSIEKEAEKLGMEIEKKVINCGMFIIPNEAATPTSIGWLDPTRWEKFKERRDGFLEKFGLKSDECMVQIWATNSDCENFHDHYNSYAKNVLGVTEDPEYPKMLSGDWYELREKLYFPDYLPLSVLKDLEEGDTLVLKMTGGYEFHIKVEQLKYRYRNYGRFEECLRMICGSRVDA